MKKLLTLIFCLILALCVFAGCKPNQTRDPNTIIIGIPKSSNITDYEDNGFTQWLEEQTGYNIEFKYYAYAPTDYSQQLATEVATGKELPDILWGFALGDTVFKEYGDDGYFIDLTELFEDKEKSEVFWDQMQKLEDEGFGDYADRIWMMIHEDSRVDGGSGAIYAYPTVSTSLVDIMEFNPYINTKWLKNLGLDAPKTKEQFVEVLRAFRDNDANGDGDKTNEVPLLGSKSGQLGGNTLEWLINFYVYYDDSYSLNIDDNGKLYTPVTQEKYRDALKWIKSLIDEKLLVTQVLDYTNQDLKTLLSSSDRVGVTVGQPTLIFAQSNDVIYNWEALDLYGYCYFNEQANSRRTFITEDCINVDAAWEILMTMSTWEGAVRQRFGVKGVHWDVADQGAMSDLGVPATIKVLEDVWGKPGNESWKSLQAGFFTYDTFDLIQTDNDPWVAKKWQLLSSLKEDQSAAVDRTIAEIGEEHILPWLRLNDEENALTPYTSDLKSEINEWRAKFLKGEKNINSDADWDAYIQALEQLGLKNYIKAYQAAYDRIYPNGHVTAG